MSTHHAPAVPETRALTASARARVLGWPLASAAGVVASAALMRATNGASAFPTCPLHAVTGLWCPFCGGTRAFLALSRGDLGAALSANLMTTLLLPAVVVGWVVVVGRTWRGVPALAAIPRVPRPVVVAVVTALLVFTVWRNLPQLPLGAWLAP